MLTHVVCFKYSPGTADAVREDHRARLRSLAADRIEGVESLKVGADLVRSARSYDTALIVVFRDRAALDAYQVHPKHVPVAKFGASVCESIVAVDFSSDPDPGASA